MSSQTKNTESHINSIYYNLSPPEEWYKTLNSILPSKLINNEFILNREIGIGNFKYLKLQEGLWIDQIHFTLHKKLTIHQLGKNKNDGFVLNFYLSQNPIDHWNKKDFSQLGFSNVSILFNSFSASLEYLLPAKKSISILHIFMSQNWLNHNIIAGDSIMNNYFKNDKPIYLSDLMDFRYKSMIERIDLNTIPRLTLFSMTIQILDYFFSKLKKRDLQNENTARIHHKDLKGLLKTRETLDTNFKESVSLEKLSYSAGMSVSKFKRLFKQVFGLTPYQYHLQIRMEKAMELLSIGKYSVSEAGHFIGYTNLSHFSDAFKNHFGILPSKVK